MFQEIKSRLSHPDFVPNKGLRRESSRVWMVASRRSWLGWLVRCEVDVSGYWGRIVCNESDLYRPGQSARAYWLMNHFRKNQYAWAYWLMNHFRENQYARAYWVMTALLCRTAARLPAFTSHLFDLSLSTIVHIFSDTSLWSVRCGRRATSARSTSVHSY